MAIFNNIEQMSSYYSLTAKKMRMYHLFEHDETVTIWQKNKASVYFLKDKRASEPRYKFVSRMSYDGPARAAYQIALNCTKDEELKSKFAQMGVTL